MLEILQTVVVLIVTISILVTIHEYGHYWVARLCNVHVLRFSVGFGKAIYMKRGRPPVVQATTEANAIDKTMHQETSLTTQQIESPQLDEAQEQQPQLMTKSNEPLEGTEFVIAAIPLGGFVKMLDEREGFVADDLKHLAFNRKNVWQRIAIVAAGPIANFLLAFLAFWFLFIAGETHVSAVIGKVDAGSPAAEAGMVAGQRITSVGGNETNSWQDVTLQLMDYMGETTSIAMTAQGEDGYQETTHQVQVDAFLEDGGESESPMDVLGLQPFFPEVPAVIGGLVAGGRAMQAGFEEGDKVISINAQPISTWNELGEIVSANPETPLRFLVHRQAITRQIDVTPEAVERIVERTVENTVERTVAEADEQTSEQGSQVSQVGIIGVYPASVSYPEDMLVQVTWPFYLAWLPAAERTWQLTYFTLSSIGKMITGAISTSSISGPITIAQFANESAESGLESYIFFLALLSISLGVINLLPIPVLDGGHLLFYSIEALAGRPVPEKVQLVSLNIGVALLVGLMGLAFFNDIARLM